MSESRIQSEIRLAASGAGYTLFRNNVGTGWAGTVERLPDGSILIRDPRPLHAGLCKGSSDLIGWRPTLILPEHVGQTLALFAAVEVKTASGRLRADQRNFLEAVGAAGGVATVARRAEDLP